MGPLKPAQRRLAGFTLVEILVVVAIVAIASAVAVVSLGRDERAQLEREARLLASSVEYAAARAQMRGETLGFSAEGGAWRYWLREDARWTPLRGDDALAAHALERRIEVRPLVYAGRPLEREAIVPLRASGRNEPFAILLASGAWQAVVRTDPLNRVDVDGPRPLP